MNYEKEIITILCKYFEEEFGCKPVIENVGAMEKLAADLLEKVVAQA